MNDRAEQIKAYLKDKNLVDPSVEIELDTPLVSSGLIDSFSLVELLSVLERVTGCRIPSSRVGPADLDTITKMLQVAERWGKAS